jgi:DMSO/TMAO reductase YedYZ heme-binding membrane subunit
MRSQLWWYCARAGGIVAWGLLSASVLWGLVMSTKVKPPRVRPAWMLDLHRFLGGLATIFVGVHIGSILLDSYTHFGLADVLVPFTSAWHPGAVAWGIVALYVLLTVELTSLARRYLPNKIWRRIHVASLPLYGLATIHFLVAGTDAHETLPRLIMFVVTAAVVGLTIVRVAALRKPPRSTPTSTPRTPGTPGAPNAPIDPLLEPVGASR